MRPWLVAAMLIAVGCSNGPPQPAGSPYDQNGCKLSCDRCPQLALCVGVPYVPVCLQACRTTPDCDSGICAIIGSNPAVPRVCFGSLKRCEADTCNNPPQCADASTQLKPLPAASGVCGWEVIHCDSGCDSATGSCK
jgi:hypothetical protein